MKSSKTVLVLLCLTFQIISISRVGASDVPIRRVVDGDTIELKSGVHVRLLQIDAPELRGNECYSSQARNSLVGLVSKASRIKLVSESRLGLRDSRGRLLRYLYLDGVNINVEMVRRGAATPWAFKGQKGTFFEKLTKAVREAQNSKAGLWAACPDTVLDTSRALETVYPTQSSSMKTKSNCDSNYAPCIPSYPPDLDCGDLKKMGISPIRVLGIDVHKLDRDGDGVGCD